MSELDSQVPHVRAGRMDHGTGQARPSARARQCASESASTKTWGTDRRHDMVQPVHAHADVTQRRCLSNHEGSTMKSQFSLLAAAVLGAAVTSTACSGESAPVESGSENITSQSTPKGAGRNEYECTIDDGSTAHFIPEFSEMHRVDAQGNVTMLDGLSFQPALSFNPHKVGTSVFNEERKEIAFIEGGGSNKFTDNSGPTTKTGTCETFEVEEVKPTSDLFTLEDTLEYACEMTDGSFVVVRPRFGEMDETTADDRFHSRDGIAFTLSSLETSPPTNQIKGVDDEGAVAATIREDAQGAKITKSSVTGTCTKQQRTKVSQ